MPIDRVAQELAEQQLRESERRYRALVEATTAVVWTADAEGKTLQFLSVREATGRSSSRIAVEDWQKSVHDDDRPALRMVWDRAMAERRPFRHVARFADPKGDYRVIVVRVVPVLDDVTKVVEWVVAAEDITEHKRADEQLRDQHERLRQTMIAGRMGWWIWDIAAHETAYSDELGRLFGLPAGGGVASRDVFLAAIHEGDRARFASIIARVLDEDLPYEAEYRVVWPDGSIHWLASRGQLERDPNGKPLRVTGIGMDISERKQTEEALRASEARMRAILDAEPECVKCLDRDGVLLDMNPAGLRMLEAESFAQIEGQCLYPLVVTKHREAFRGLTATVFRGESGVLEFQIVGLKGGRRWLECHASPLRDANGDIVSLIGVSRDITDRKRMEETREKLVCLIEHSKDFIAMADLDGRITFMNAGARKMIGLSDDEDPRDLHFTDYVPQEWQEFFLDTVVGTARKHGHWEGEMQFRHRQSGALVDVFRSTFLIRDAVGQPSGYATVTRDITAAKRAEEALRASEGLLRAVADGTIDAVFVKDRDGKYLLFNEAAARFVGKPAAEVLGLDDTALFDPVGAAVVMGRDRRVMATGQVETEEETLTAAGATRTYLSTKGPYRDETGTVVGVIGISRDITETKRTQERLATQHAVVSILAQSANLREATPRLLQAICETTGWDLGDLWVVDRSANVLVCVDLWHVESLGADEFCDVTRRITFAPGVCLPGYVWSTRQPTWIEDIAKDPKIRRAEVATKAGLHGGLGFPIQFGNELLGVAEFFSRESRPPDTELLLMFDSLGSQIGQFMERKRAEEGLRLFRALIDQTTDAIEVIDPETGRYLDVNSRACTVHGYTREEYLSLAVSDIDPRVAERPWGELMADREQAGFPTFESWHRRKDGSTFPVEVNINSIRLDRDYIVAVVRDITERNRTEEALRLRDRAIRGVTQGILITDCTLPDNPIIYASPGFEAITGYSAAEAVGKNCRFLQGAMTDPHEVGIVRGALQDGLPCTVELLNYKKDGSTFWNELSISPVRDAAGHVAHFVGVQSDVTARRSLQEQFRQAQKMESIGQLAGGVAHDFNNLLTIINGYSDLLLERLGPTDPMRALLVEISKAGERAGGLTRQLLAFSRKQVLDPKVLNLNAVVSDTEKMLRRLLGEDVLLATSLDPALGSVKADPGQIDQILLNLAVNARDAMPTGGRLTIETRNATLDATYCATHVEVRPGDYVLLAVSDSGHGMDATTATRIFEPFFTTKGIGKGTGLGLATVHGIVKQSGGHVAVYSEIDRGTTFKVYLPHASDALSAKKPQSVSRTMPRGTETVLLVEDEDAVRALGQYILQTCGYTVLEATDGLEALQIAEAHPGPIHLLMSDVIMPHLGGRELAEKIRAVRPACKVLFLSGYTDDAVVRHGVLEAEFAFLQKPYTPSLLAQKVRGVLDEVE